MPLLTSDRLTKQLNRAVSSSAYSDKGKLLQDTISSLDAYGQPSVTTTSYTVKCSFTDRPDMESWKDFADIESISAEVRFKHKTAVPVRGNRFTVTSLFQDVDYIDATFEVIGIRNRGSFGYVCALKKVQI